MKNFLFIVVIILIAGWLIGVFGLHTGGVIHSLLIAAAILLLTNFIQGKKGI